MDDGNSSDATHRALVRADSRAVDRQPTEDMLEQTDQSGRGNGLNRVSAHQLHNLVTVIIAEAQLLQLDFSDTDVVGYRSAIAIERAGRQLEQLVDQLVAAGTIRARNDTDGATTPAAGLPEAIEEAGS